MLLFWSPAPATAKSYFSFLCGWLYGYAFSPSRQRLRLYNCTYHINRDNSEAEMAEMTEEISGRLQGAETQISRFPGQHLTDLYCAFSHSIWVILGLMLG